MTIVGIIGALLVGFSIGFAVNEKLNVDYCEMQESLINGLHRLINTQNELIKAQKEQIDVLNEYIKTLEERLVIQNE